MRLLGRESTTGSWVGSKVVLQQAVAGIEFVREKHINQRLRQIKDNQTLLDSSWLVRFKYHIPDSVSNGVEFFNYQLARGLFKYSYTKWETELLALKYLCENISHEKAEHQKVFINLEMATLLATVEYEQHEGDNPC